MTELYSPEHLEHVASGLVLLEALGVLLQLLQDGVIHVLKHQVQLAPTTKHFDQVDQILVTKTLKKNV